MWKETLMMLDQSLLLSVGFCPSDKEMRLLEAAAFELKLGPQVRRSETNQWAGVFPPISANIQYN